MGEVSSLSLYSMCPKTLFCHVVPGYICAVAGQGLLGKIVGTFSMVTGLIMLFGGTFFILKRVVTGSE